MDTVLESVRGLFSSKIYVKPSGEAQKTKITENTYLTWLVLSETPYEIDQSLSCEVKKKLKTLSFEDAVARLTVKADRSTEWTFIPELGPVLSDLENCISIFDEEAGFDNDLKIRELLETLEVNADLGILLSKKKMIIYAAAMHTLVEHIMYESVEPFTSIIYGYGKLMNLWYEVEIRKKHLAMESRR